MSHNLGLVRFLCDRVAIMYLGRIVETGPAALPRCREALPELRSIAPGRTAACHLLEKGFKP